MKKSIENAFNKLAYNYENMTDDDSPYNSYYERPAMLAELPEKLDGLHILDAGCAAGWYSKVFAERGAEVTAIDLSPEMVDAARRRLNGKGTVLCHDVEDTLPFDNDSFDLIVSSLTLHYIEEWKPVFGEFHRILKPGGKLLFSVHHPFMEFTYFKCNDYFEKKIVLDTWHKGDTPIEVISFHRSLQEVTGVTSDFFTIEKLVEPQPVQEFKDVKEKTYQYLMTNPHFLIVKAVKKVMEKL